MCAIRSVYGADGRLHIENENGNIRFDSTTGQFTRLLGKPGTSGRLVQRPDGSIGFEKRFGNFRYSADNGNTDRIV